MTIDWVRGSCPRCDDDQVLHHVIGMPAADAYRSSPSWVHWAGCTGLGPDRECVFCEYTWWEDDHGHFEDPEPWEAAPGEEEEEEELVELAPLRVVGAVIIEGDRILTARRGPGKDAAGLWEFPGGKIEPGESPQQALAREVREELGVEVEVGWLIGRGEGGAGERELHLDCYWARLRGASPLTSTDHDALEWVPRDQLAQRTWAEPDVPIIRQIQDGAAPAFTSC